MGKSKKKVSIREKLKCKNANKSALTAFHAYLISTGQSSIERLINKKSKAADRPYDRGFKENWLNHFGVRKKRFYSDLIIRVLLPSLHEPLFDGVNWSSSTVKAYYSV